MARSLLSLLSALLFPLLALVIYYSGYGAGKWGTRPTLTHLGKASHNRKDLFPWWPWPLAVGGSAGRAYTGLLPSALLCAVTVQALCTSLQAAEPRLPSHLPQSLLHPMWSMGCSMTIPTPNPPFCLQGSRRWSLLAKKLFCKWIYFCMEKKVFFFKNSSFPLCPMQEALMAGSRLLGFLPPGSLILT